MSYSVKFLFYQTATSSERRFFLLTFREELPNRQGIRFHSCSASFSALALVHTSSVSLLRPVSSVLLFFAGGASPPQRTGCSILVRCTPRAMTSRWSFARRGWRSPLPRRAHSFLGERARPMHPRCCAFSRAGAHGSANPAEPSRFPLVGAGSANGKREGSAGFAEPWAPAFQEAQHLGGMGRARPPGELCARRGKGALQPRRAKLHHDRHSSGRTANQNGSPPLLCGGGQGMDMLKRVLLRCAFRVALHSAGKCSSSPQR